MRYNMLTVLNNHEGQEMHEGGPDTPVVTLRSALVQACLVADTRKHSQPGAKYEIYKLMRRIHENDVCELSAEEITLLKTLADECYNVIMVGLLTDILECRPRADHG